AMPELRETIPVPVTGLLETASRSALEAGRDIGVLATLGTIRSDAYGAAIRRMDSRARIRGLACTTWVPLVESGAVSGETPLSLVREALVNWQDMPPLDAVILGCTHFPFLEDLIRTCLPGHPRLVDPGPLVAAEVLAGMPEGPGQDGLLTVWSSGDTGAFLNTVQRLVPELGLTEVLPWRLPAIAPVSRRTN
ncbi:MAG: aspartate/glutamate racemase family protein, partial [Candidatus Sericytochromatia bacterium]|nr:aspartate/glutamate racemase family protein [Candidatus Sericytochromatia bacterium]